MAQKQFKIGLSNTDKQNMAQDVYERLLALTFNEYDTTTEYEVGDFVVYNDQLYKCIGATSGAWDSTKWQLATLNDLVDDIENAVAFVNDKANVDGNYPTMTVGVADQLSPYDENSGDDQDEPFSFQATGTGNGSQPDFSTGSIALMKEKQGNTVVVNQLVPNNQKSGSVTPDGTTTYSLKKVNLSLLADKTYIVIVKLTNAEDRQLRAYCVVGVNTYGSPAIDIPANSSKLCIWKITPSQNVSEINFGFSDILASQNLTQTWSYSELSICNLPQWFNGDIPQDILDHPSNFFRYYQGSLAYNEGTLVNANGRYIKCIGMNQWDEEWEEGSYSTSNGNKDDWQASGGSIRSKNKVKVIPNTTYYCKVAASTGNYILFYDIDNNYLGYVFIHSTGETFTTPANAYYITYRKDGVSTYGNDTSINLYYEDEERCLTYEPYEVLTNNDTGTETLRSAGSVKDYKDPDGTIHRRVGMVDLGTINWDTYSSPENHVFRAALTNLGIKPTATNNVLANAICPLYSIMAFEPISASDNMCFSISSVSNDRIVFINQSYSSASAFKTAMSGVYLFYELAEPTTEQGTPYSENLVIDDFGSMDFGSTNGVPQGALIFYPVDYKAFIDTLYDYTDGTPSNIALKSDLASDKSELQGVDTQLLNAVGGTLRQCLCVKESLDFDNTAFVDLGDLSWALDGTYQGVFYTTISDMKSAGDWSAIGKLLCSLYKTSYGNKLADANTDKLVCVTPSGQLWVKDKSYANAVTFKNAMKGVLLAYEKASE